MGVLILAILGGICLILLIYWNVRRWIKRSFVQIFGEESQEQVNKILREFAQRLRHSNIVELLLWMILNHFYIEGHEDIIERDLKRLGIDPTQFKNIDDVIEMYLKTKRQWKQLYRTFKKARFVAKMYGYKVKPGRYSAYLEDIKSAS